MVGKTVTAVGTAENMAGRTMTAIGIEADYARQDHDRRWDGRANGWHGNNPVAAGHTPGDNGYNHGWGNGTSGWQGHNSAGGTTTNGTTTAGYTRGQGTSGSGWQGHNSGGSGTTTGGTTTSGTTSGTTTAGYTRGQGTSGSGWQGHNSGKRTAAPPPVAPPPLIPRAGKGTLLAMGSRAPRPTGPRYGQSATWQGQQQYQRPGQSAGLAGPAAISATLIPGPASDEARSTGPLAGAAISASSLADASNRYAAEYQYDGSAT